MTDIEKLRADIVRELTNAQGGDALNQASADGLMMMFNKLAPHRAIEPHEYGSETPRQRLTRLIETLPPQEATDHDRPPRDSS